MILDDKSITELTRKGVKLVNSKGEPVRVKRTFTPLPKEDPEIEHLRRIETLLEAILSRPQPALPTLPAPQVTVQPAEVVVQPSSVPAPNPPIRKWKFELVRGFQGLTEHIIATAIE